MDPRPEPTPLSAALVCTVGALVLSGLFMAGPAWGQEDDKKSHGEGFTILLSLGPGWQRDVLFGESAVGLGGLNLGIGGFLSDDLALMFRATGTSVTLDLHEEWYDPIIETTYEFSYEVYQVSGVVALSVQYWVSDRINVEGGPGLGFRQAEGAYDRSLGFFMGVGFVVYHVGNSNFQIGLEFAPVFSDPKPVYNLGIVAGWQFL